MIRILYNQIYIPPSKGVAGWCEVKVLGKLAKVLGKFAVPGRPTNLDNSRARAYRACSRCGWGLFGHFSLVYLFSFLSLSLGDSRYRLQYRLKGPLKPIQPTNPPSKPKWKEAHTQIDKRTRKTRTLNQMNISLPNSGHSVFLKETRVTSLLTNFVCQITIQN